MEKENIKVSIIMPSLNVRDFIEEAIESVLNQSLNDIEVICVDAGSTDGTYEIILGYAKRDSRIRVLKSNVRSYGAQVNYGIYEAKGKYIAILETDDFVDQNMYLCLYNLIEENQCDYVKSDYYAYFTQQNGERFYLRRRNFLNDDLYDKIITPKDHWQIATDDWYLWQGIYKKDFLTRNNITFSETKGAAYQDIGFLYQVIRNANKAIYIKDFHYRYCIDRDESSSNSHMGLEYSYNEFRRLHDLFIPEKDNKLNLLYYGRMAKSFLHSYSEIIQFGSKLEKSKITEYYLWFRNQLQKAIDSLILLPENVHCAIWKKLMELLKSQDDFEKVMKNKAYELISSLGSINESRIIIFGCGNFGYEAYKWLLKHEYEIEGFLDNDDSLWNKKLNGLMIFNPNSFDYTVKNIKYLVANERYFEQIKSQLITNGVASQDIIIYR